jgi:invasion protein IalB
MGGSMSAGNHKQRNPKPTISPRLVPAVALISSLALGPGLAIADDPQSTKAKSPWIKLCEKAPVQENGKTETREVCITHHERLDPNTGLPVISAAIRTTEGQSKIRFLVTVPVSIAMPSEIQAKIDGMPEPVRLQYTFCLPNGCTAETEATPAIIEKLGTGNTLLISATNANRDSINFSVPLRGLKTALDGPPVRPSSPYGGTRRQLLLRIRENMIARAKAAEARDKKNLKD